MATLKELLDARVDKTKPIKVRYSGWDKHIYHKITDSTGEGDAWELYEEPKKKVKWYAYLKIPRDVPKDGQFTAEVLFFYNETLHSTGAYWTIRIPQLDVEVEE